MATALATVALLGCGEDAASDAPAGTAVSASGYEIELPDGWTPSDEDAPGEAPTDVYFRDGEGPLRTNLSVVAEQLPAGIAFDEAVDDGAKLIADLPEADLRSGPDGTTVDGEEAFETSYTTTQGGRELQFSLVQALHDGSIYSIGLTSSPEYFEEAKTEFDQIIDSWTWS